MDIPAKKRCLEILKVNEVPKNIVLHLKKVHDFSMKVCSVLEKRGIRVNKKLVGAAALLHDVYKLKSGRHEIDGADYVESLGYGQVAEIIRKHGLKNLSIKEYHPKTWEEKIVFYSDKRCSGNKIVSVEERFNGIKHRHFSRDKALNKSDKTKIPKNLLDYELRITKKIEKELLNGEAV